MYFDYIIHITSHLRQHHLMKLFKLARSNMSMIMSIAIFFLIIATFLNEEVQSHSHSHSKVEGRCLRGAKHKSEPSPEDDSYKACRLFKNSSCCTSEFTNQLAVENVQRIGNFSWTLCGNLSKRCQEYMIGVECFYSCSPYVGLWAHPIFDSALKNAPVCSSYCNDWFDACKDDMTCAENWVTGFNFTEDGHNQCKQNCTTFKDFYNNGTELCNTMWHNSFTYVKETEHPDRCLHFRYNTSHDPNIDVVERIFNMPSTPTMNMTTSTTPNTATGLHCLYGLGLNLFFSFVYTVMI